VPVRAVRNELRQARNILLFLEDLAPLLVRSSVPAESYFRTILQAALDQGEVQCIGITTPAQVQTDRANAGLLLRHFQLLDLATVSQTETLEALRRLRGR